MYYVDGSNAESETLVRGRLWDDSGTIKASFNHNAPDTVHIYYRIAEFFSGVKVQRVQLTESDFARYDSYDFSAVATYPDAVDVDKTFHLLHYSQSLVNFYASTFLRLERPTSTQVEIQVSDNYSLSSSLEIELQVIELLDDSVVEFFRASFTPVTNTFTATVADSGSPVILATMTSDRTTTADEFSFLGRKSSGTEITFELDNAGSYGSVTGSYITFGSGIQTRSPYCPMTNGESEKTFTLTTPLTDDTRCLIFTTGFQYCGGKNDHTDDTLNQVMLAATSFDGTDLTLKRGEGTGINNSRPVIVEFPMKSPWNPSDTVPMAAIGPSFIF